MKAGITVQICSAHNLNQFKETRKRTLRIQHLQHVLILPAIEEDERRKEVEGIGVVFLQQPVNDLSSYIVRMTCKYA